MGRSITFDHKGIKLPLPLISSRTLQQIGQGDIVALTFTKTSSNGHSYSSSSSSQELTLDPPSLQRSPSTYGKLNTPINQGIYICTNTDYDPEIKNVGLRSLVFRNIIYNPIDYYVDWIITTDGFVREVEACGISHCVNQVRILKKKAEINLNLE